MGTVPIFAQRKWDCPWGNVMARPTVLAFMAHPDDAEFSAGTLVRLAACRLGGPHRLCRAGDCGTDDRDPLGIAARRSDEARRRRADRRDYHCLDERDGLVVYDKPALRKTLDLFRAVGRAGLCTRGEGLYDGPRDGLLSWPGPPVSLTEPRTSRRVRSARARAFRTSTIAIRSEARTRWAWWSGQHWVDIAAQIGSEGRDAGLPRQPRPTGDGLSRGG